MDLQLLKKAAESAMASPEKNLEYILIFHPSVALELIERLERAEKIVAAAENLVKVKGRHHSEQAYTHLVAAMNGGKE